MVGVLDSWQLAELAVLFVELDLAEQSAQVQIEHDVRLRDRQSGAFRQIDVLVRATVNEHEFLRIVEVQRRKEPVGLPQIEAWTKKAENVGAHRLTVAAAAYRNSALKFVENRADYIQAYELVEARPSDWPFAGSPAPIDIKLDDDDFTMTRSDFLYRRVGSETGRYLALVNLVAPATVFVLAIVFQQDSESGEIRPRIEMLDRSQHPIRDLRVAVRYKLADGSEGRSQVSGFERRAIRTGPLARRGEPASQTRSGPPGVT